MATRTSISLAVAGRNHKETRMRPTALLVGLFSFFMLNLGACEREGPAEKAGEKVDEATEQTGETLERAGERVEEQSRQ